MLQYSLDELLTYARCPMEWYWQYRAQAASPRTPDALVGEAIREGLFFYYAGHASEVAEAVFMVWSDWIAAWGYGDELLDELLRYAQGRGEILALFTSGRITRPGGGRYLVPQMTREYKRRMNAAGLGVLGERLDAVAIDLGLTLPEDDRYVGSAFGDAFADCIEMARQAGAGSFQLPAPDVVAGARVPFVIPPGSNIQVTGEADLVLWAPEGSGEGAVVLEVHDYRRSHVVLASRATRGLRVIAASMAKPAPGEQSSQKPVSWETVDHVVYRHFLSGESFVIRQTSPGRLLTIVSALARGIRSQVIVPRFLAGAEACRSCAYRPHCFSPGGWDTLDLHNPTVFAQAERLLQTVDAVRKEIAGNDQAAQRTRAALSIIQEALHDEAPDLHAMEPVLSEAVISVEGKGSG